jgi:hypothetical protein
MLRFLIRISLAVLSCLIRIFAYTYLLRVPIIVAALVVALSILAFTTSGRPLLGNLSIYLGRVEFSFCLL